MISKKRLEELIEQEATIYDSGIVDVIEIKLKIDDWVEENGVLHKKSNMFGGFRYFYDEKLFETLEEAEWHREFGCVERTERLELPTWEEFKNKKIKQVCFIGRDTICFYELYEDTKNNRLILLDHDCDYEYFNEELTKENYTLACRRARELFLGQSNDN